MIDDGVHGMAFIETVVKSSKLGAKWLTTSRPPIRAIPRPIRSRQACVAV
jgi:hypothetical protein